MNQPPPEQWQDLARIWQGGATSVSSTDIERLQRQQARSLRAARIAELACTLLGVVAALWLAMSSRLRGVGIITAVLSLASVILVLRTRRRPVPQANTELLQSLQDALDYQDWLAEQLRYGRILGFIALFAVVQVGATQLMHLASATHTGLLATLAAGLAVGAAVAWNMALAWRVWRRTVRLRAFRQKLVDEQTPLL